MKPMCMPSTKLFEFDCKIEVLLQTPDSISAENAFYPRQSACGPLQAAAQARYFRDKDEELALCIEAFQQSPRLPSVWLC